MAVLTIATMNWHGQTKFTNAKQYFIQDFLKLHKIEVLVCQETRIKESDLTHCEYIYNNFTIIKNNSHNEYSTSIFIKNELQIEVIKLKPSK